MHGISENGEIQREKTFFENCSTLGKMSEASGMMTRFMIASNTRPGIDLESLVAKHEFSVVSKSMFTTDGMPIPCNDKSMLLSTLEENVEYKLTPLSSHQSQLYNQAT